jgi:hypothetical protein
MDGEDQELVEIVGGDVGDSLTEDEILIVDGDDTTDDDDAKVQAGKASRAERAIETEVEKARREAAEAKQELARAKWESENAKNAAEWNKRLGQINTEFNNARTRIKQQAPGADDPIDFIDREMERLIAWKEGELGKFHGMRERGYQEQLAFASLPQYADKLVKDYNLKRADREKLLAMGDPVQMEARAMGLADMRELERNIAGNNKKAAQKLDVAISTGGAGSGNVRKIKAGSDEHLFHLMGGSF